MAKTASKSPAPAKKPVRARKLRTPKYRSFRLEKRIKNAKPKLTSAFRLFSQSLKFLKQHWRLFGGIVLVYFVLSIVLVNGFGSSANISELRNEFATVFSNSVQDRLTISLSLIAALFGSSNTPASDVAGAYRSIIVVIVSLATIWGLRQVMSGKKVSVKDTFYKGLYPVIPVLLVMFVIVLQLLPTVAAGSVYSTIFTEGMVLTLVEKILWWMLIGLLFVWTFYMVSSSVFAVYIATLPDMTPLKALRAARELVRYRRWAVIRKLFFLPIALALALIVIMLPIIWLLAPVAEWIFFLLSMTSLVVAHTYIYNLYRELL